MSEASGEVERKAAVVLAAHGDRAGDDPNAGLLRVRDALARSGDFATVSAGVLKGEPTLESALADASQSGASAHVIYPMFMADGYFVRTVLADRVAAAGLPIRFTLTPPLGLEPELPSLMVSQALSAALKAGFKVPATRLLVVGHGSKFGPASAEATREAARKLAETSQFKWVETAFLEEEPSLEQSLKDPRSTVVSGFFGGDGMHAGEDVPEALRRTRANAVYAGSLGADSAAIAALVRRSLLAALAPASDPPESPPSVGCGAVCVHVRFISPA